LGTDFAGRFRRRCGGADVAGRFRRRCGGTDVAGRIRRNVTPAPFARWIFVLVLFFIIFRSSAAHRTRTD
jgi:hypothetical protein